MRRLLRLPHHAGQRNRRICLVTAAAGGRHLRPGGKRSGGHQHGLWRGLGRHPGDDRVLRAGHQPDAGRHIVSGRSRAAVRDRGHSARRAGAGKHRPGAERLFRHHQGRRPRLLSQHRGGARLCAGDGLAYHAGLRSGRQVSQSSGGAGRWLRRADDGAGRA